MKDNTKDKDQQVADQPKSKEAAKKDVKDIKAGKGKSLTGKPLDPIDLNPTDETDKMNNEAVEKTVVFTFGRMNPPTIGHQKLVDKVRATAKVVNGDPKIFLSHSEDSSKNPLPYSVKVALAKKAFGNIVTQSRSKNIIDILKELSRSYHNAILVVGSDRVVDFDRMVKNYNGKDFTFKSVRVVSAGERDPDAEGAEGMSASKMRAAAKADDIRSFKKGLPQKLQSMAPGLMSTLQSKMNEAFEVFMESYPELLDERNLTQTQRRARKALMRVKRKAIERGRKIARRKMANQKTMKRRARRAARNAIRSRYAGEKGKSYATLSPAEKIMVDRRIQGKGKLIDRIATKLLPKVRKAEIVRLRTMRLKKVNEAMDPNRQKAMDAALAKVKASLPKQQQSVKSEPKPAPKDPHADKHPVWKTGFAHGKANRRDPKASDAYGPNTHHYDKGFEAGRKEVNEISMDLQKRYNTLAKSDLSHQKMSARIAGEIGAKDAQKHHQRKAKNRAVGIMRTEERTPQDQDIADRKGTQPARYHKGVAPSTKVKRDAHFKRQAKKASTDSLAYSPAPGDATAETKPSEFTTQYHAMYGEQVEVNETSAIMQTIHRHSPLMKPKYKSAIRHYLNLRRKEPGQGRALVTKAVKHVGLEPRDTDNIIHHLHNYIKKGILPPHLKVDEETALQRVSKKHDTEKDRLRMKHDREKDLARTQDTRIVNRRTDEEVNIDNPNQLFELVDQMMDRIEQVELSEKSNKALQKKADASGYSYSTLKAVYDRGVAAWRTGHRPGTTPEQWGYARVNAFIAKQKSGKKLDHDTDLASKKQKTDEQYSFKSFREAVDQEKSSKVYAKVTPDQSLPVELAVDGIPTANGAIVKPHVTDVIKEDLNEAFEGMFGGIWAEVAPTVKELGPAYDKFREGTFKLDSDLEEAIRIDNYCETCDLYEDLIVEEAEYQGKKVKLNDPIRTSEVPSKKFKVYVKNDQGNVVVVRFGDPGLSIKRDDPDRRRSFRARHNCDDPGPKWKARYWSCYQWRSGAKVDN
jgi:hypothetical protein